ncbi:MAG: OmpA family protein [Magnetospirillum sp. WYHS-4]
MISRRRLLWAALVSLFLGTGSGLAYQAQGLDPEGSADYFRTRVGAVVFFAHDRIGLDPEAKAVLDRQAAWLKRHSEYHVVLVGHTDERGTLEHSLAIGERQAAAVKSYLAAQGIEGTRIEARSADKSHPLAPGHTDAAWAQNRRVETILTASVSYATATGTLTCNAGSLVQCGLAGCEAPSPVPSSLSLDYGSGAVGYCLATACYDGKAVLVRSEGAELIAFDGQRAQPGEPRSAGWLVTIHPGRKAATVGRFEADGGVSFATLACEGGK